MDNKAAFKKLWLLAILNAVRAVGIGSAPSAFIHRMIYFTTALAVVSRQDPEVACVIKRNVGPYFPDYAWELERLVGMGLVNTRNQSVDIDEIDALALYKISDHGLTLLHDICRSVNSLAKSVDHVGFCIRELAFAGVLQDQDAWEEDANQRSRTTIAGELIDYGEIQPSSRVNFSAIEAAQLLGISTETFDSPNEASEVLRRGIFWDQRENVPDVQIHMDSQYIQGMSITDLLPSHGPSLFARNLGIRRSTFKVAQKVQSSKDVNAIPVKFEPPDLAWADQEVEGA